MNERYWSEAAGRSFMLSLIPTYETFLRVWYIAEQSLSCYGVQGNAMQEDCVEEEAAGEP